MVVCETKVAVIDLVAETLKELPKAATEGKPPCGAAVLRQAAAEGREPVACVAGNDGTVRCVHLGGSKLLARLTGQK
eukprot:scaffold649994_cov46-Prasinocladus_malaysianus.AAC.1